jgi:hypothetical protein
MSSERKEQVNSRLTPTARTLLVRIADVWGVGQGDVIEMLLRAEGARIGIGVGRELPKVPPPFPSKDEQQL